MPNGNNQHRIPEPIVPEDGQRNHVKFSFKHIDLNSDEYGPRHCSDQCLRSLIVRLREYSSWAIENFQEQNNREHRHVIDFRQTKFPDGFPNVDFEQVAYHDAWQFELHPGQPWRVYGILIDDTFFVIWLDPNHSLYLDPDQVE
jgi:hypothetical protein